ncbi:MAG: bifunctional DNA primase/polymerase [Acidimicrobiia bacterium]|nr:bifunctional DNA primase/polymerase [Acidimicrobiia bacterium]
MREFGAVIETWPADDLGADALRYGQAGYEVFPLRGKVPAIAKRDGGNGVLDATTDLLQIAAWWTKYPGANIGGRVPSGVVVVDIDPRSGGLDTWGALIAENGDFTTRTAWSGRNDGGRHIYVGHPGGRVRGSIGAGLDVKTHSGYTVLPPSIHPSSRKPYRWDDPTAPIVLPPAWLADLLRAPPVVPKVPTSQPTAYAGDSIADWYTATHTWADTLGAHGWTLVAGDGDSDGSKWRHPTSTSSEPASIKNGCLFVYSPNTVFDVTEAESPHGYTRFRAYAVLDHGGDLSAAARAAREIQGAAA